eukprot:653366-Heterocapsa_arctica.AAC.1
MRRAIGVEGVGQGSQVATQEVNVPGAIRSMNGLEFDSLYTAPMLSDSDVPALLGLRSLKRTWA